MKQVKQFIYDNNNFKNKNLLEGISDVYSIGIQAIPGTRFSLIKNTDQTYPLVIGRNGIFELNVKDEQLNVNYLGFDSNSLDRHQNSGFKLIVDILYDNGGR